MLTLTTKPNIRAIGGIRHQLSAEGDDGSFISLPMNAFWFLYAMTDMVSGLIRFFDDTRAKHYVFDSNEGELGLKFERRKGNVIWVFGGASGQRIKIGQADPATLSAAITALCNQIEVDQTLRDDLDQTVDWEAEAWPEFTKAARRWRVQEG